MVKRTLVTSTVLLGLSNAVAVLPKKDALQVLKNNFDSKKQYNEERPRLPESALETFSEETRQHWDEYFPEARMEWNGYFDQSQNGYFWQYGSSGMNEAFGYSNWNLPSNPTYSSSSMVTINVYTGQWESNVDADEDMAPICMLRCGTTYDD